MDDEIIPATQLPGFAGHSHYFTMDPSGINRHAISGLSAKGVMDSKGFQVFMAGTNDIDPRLKAIEMYLTEIRSTEGDFYRSLVDLKREGPSPAIIIDPGCPVLISALSSRYRYKRNKAGELEPKPEKKHPISDVTDSLGYLCMGVNTGQFKRMAANIGIPSSRSPALVNARGWT